MNKCPLCNRDITLTHNGICQTCEDYLINVILVAHEEKRKNTQTHWLLIISTINNTTCGASLKKVIPLDMDLTLVSDIFKQIYPTCEISFKPIFALE